MGRVAFFARIDVIRAEIAQGWPLTAVYGRHKDALGISYSGFLKLVARHAADARPMPAQAARGRLKRTHHPARSDSGDESIRVPEAPRAAAPSDEGSSPHAGYQPARTFSHDPVERPGDYERLFGTRKR